MAKFDAYAYLDAAAAAMDLRIPAESRDAVAANLTRLEALARQIAASEGTVSAVPDSRPVSAAPDSRDEA